MESFFSAIFEFLTNVNYDVTNFPSSTFPGFSAVDISSFSASSSSFSS